MPTVEVTNMGRGPVLVNLQFFLKNAMENSYLQKNECWVNSLLSEYSGCRFSRMQAALPHWTAIASLLWRRTSCNVPRD